MNTKKIFTHLVYYRLFGENHFCWQSWEEPFRPISNIYGQLFFSLIAEHAQSKSSSDNDAFVHVHNKNVITLHWKNWLVLWSSVFPFRLICSDYFFLYFPFFLKSEFFKMRRTLMTMILHKNTEAFKLSSKPPIHVTKNKQTNEWTN